MESGIEQFSGINVRASRTDIVESQLARSINADLHETVGTLRLRNGRESQFSPALSAAPYSLFRNGVSATRYRAAGTSLYRSQTVVTDYRNLPFSGDLATDFTLYKPLNDSTTWTFAADRGAMQKDDGTVCRRWGLRAPDQLKIMEDDTTATLIYAYRFGLTEIRYDGSSIAHESNPSDSTIADDRDKAGDVSPRPTATFLKTRKKGRRNMYLNATGPGICKIGYVEFWVTDGDPPYKWSATNGSIADLTLTVFGLNGDHARVVFVGNTGSGVSGIAYRQWGYEFACTDSSFPQVCNTNTPSCSGSPNCCGCRASSSQDRGCNNQDLGGQSAGAKGDCAVIPGGACGAPTPFLVGADTFGCAAANGVQVIATGVVDHLSNNNDEGLICDARTQAMKDDGCKPCIIVQAENPAVVTVTDSTGRSVSAVVFS